MFKVIQKTTGTIIDRFATREQAEKAAQSCEQCDIMLGEWNGTYDVQEEEQA